MAHAWNSNRFLAYRVSSSGVDSLPVQSAVGIDHSGDLSDKTSVGYMKFSPSGDKLALAVLGSGIVEVFDFDNSTGQVSNVLTIPSPVPEGPYGIEFSPDGSKLYVTFININTNLSNSIYQYDLSTAAPPVQLQMLYNDFTAMQLAVDGKIYVARINNNSLGVIENPDRPGLACNFREAGLSIGSMKSNNGMPVFVSSFLNIPFFDCDTKCHGDNTNFILLNTSNIDSISWSFGDAASAANISGQFAPVHVFSNPGNYTVSVTEWFEGQAFTRTRNIRIDPLPPKSFASYNDSVYIIPGSVIKLDGGEAMKTYFWQDGSSDRYFEASLAGYYHVSIVDTNCCAMSDTLKVVYLDLVLPSAFTPDQDGHNDWFRAKGANQGVDDFSLYVYNKWGQLVWHTSDLLAGWDGTFNGQACPLGVYSYILRYSSSGEAIKKKSILKKGMVTLIR
jgi:gliding motility-associated-like protein